MLLCGRSKSGALLFALVILPCGAADELPGLSHVREVNLERAVKLPNFVADEIALRYQKGKKDTDWRVFDRIESEIAVRGKDGFTRQNVRLNGQPWVDKNGGDKPFPNWNFGVAFGDELSALFDPKCPTVIEFEKQEQWNGKPALAYRFNSRPDGCFGYWEVNRNGIFSRTKRYNPARRGRFLVDDKANLVRFEMEAINFPKDFGNDTWTEAATYDYVKIGDESHLLPVAFDTEIGASTGELFKAHVEYRNHRHFEASTNVQFK